MNKRRLGARSDRYRMRTCAPVCRVKYVGQGMRHTGRKYHTYRHEYTYTIDTMPDTHGTLHRDDCSGHLAHARSACGQTQNHAHCRADPFTRFTTYVRRHSDTREGTEAMRDAIALTRHEVLHCVGSLNAPSHFGLSSACEEGLRIAESEASLLFLLWIQGQHAAVPACEPKASVQHCRSLQQLRPIIVTSTNIALLV